MLMMVGWLLSMTASAKEETKIYQFDKPLYGAAYYSEYTPTDRLDEDIRMMKDAGLTVARVGESTWSLFEPQDGKFEFAWMDRILDKMQAAGIKVILGTPTYSIPSWLAAEHPEVLSQTWDGLHDRQDGHEPLHLLPKGKGADGHVGKRVHPQAPPATLCKTAQKRRLQCDRGCRHDRIQ